MKKVFIGVLVLFSLFACDPIEWLTGNMANFYIKNSTSKALDIVRFEQNNKYAGGLPTIIPGDSVSICSYMILYGYNTLPKFDDLHQKFESITVEDWSTGDTLASHLNFFNEEDWAFYREEKGANSRFTWVFEIHEEDIMQEESINP
jgi:hypothetical protein